MVNFHDPAVVLSGLWTLVKLCHATDSLYLWEFFTSIGYEWSVIRGHRPYRWTIWIYSFTRLASLVAVILNMIGLDVATPYNCQVWLFFELMSGSAAFVSASLLIVLRIIAIWSKDKVVATISIGVWVTNIAFIIQGIARLRAKWIPTRGSCVVPNTEITKLNITVTLVTDIILLLIMLVGLLRIRHYGGGTFGLAQLIWKQGVIWLFLATIAEVPPTVFISLHLNEPFNMMFQVPSLTIMSIAATRMYRSLADFASESTDIFQDGAQPNCRTLPKVMRTTQVRAPVTRLEVTTHSVNEQHAPSQLWTGRSSDDSYIATDGQLRHHPFERSRDDAAERGVESGVSW